MIGLAHNLRLGVIAEGGPLHAKTGSASWDAYLARLRASGRTHHAESLDRNGGRPVRSGLES